MKYCVFFYDSGNFQPDRAPVRGSSIDDLDRYLLSEFFENVLNRPVDRLGMSLEKALQNLFILDTDGEVTLGGLMYFGKRPQRLCPAFNIKAVWFFGNDIGGSDYRDSKDIDGTIPRIFDEGMRFLESCLHRVQAGQNFNSIGILEVSEIALRELLQNALVHRSWLKPAPIRILVFDNRVEIVSPGALPPSLTVDDIKLGNAFQRNQLIANLCAKTMDYRGLGSGILRALKADSDIEFRNEISGDQFRVILWRTTRKDSEESDQQTTRKTEGKEKGDLKTTRKTLSLMKVQPRISRDQLAKECRVSADAIKLQIRKLRESGKIRRVGPDKGGHWEVL